MLNKISPSLHFLKKVSERSVPDAYPRRECQRPLDGAFER